MAISFYCGADHFLGSGLDPDSISGSGLGLGQLFSGIIL
jgi:hypothetical protein